MARYSDIDMNFTSHPTKKDVTKRLDEEAVKQSIKNLVFLNFYEKPFNPEIGSGIRNMLFELNSPIASLHIKNHIVQVIKNYEPRCELVDVRVAYTDTNAFSVTIMFTIKNLPNPVTFSFYLQRVR